MSDRRIVLASRSPRRAALLAGAGWDVAVRTTAVDDGDLQDGAVPPAAWTTALAWLKARAVWDMLWGTSEPSEALPIVAGDTVCEHGGVMLGQPADAAEAASMIHGMQGASHAVWTGLCVLLPGKARRIGVDRAMVHVGEVPASEIEAYVASGRWRGKAGGYNLSERIDAGWPITYDGHASTIMGMPMPLLERLIGDDLA
ncbi:MAG: Maf family protein [Phycisphaerales bacterium]|jgi:septum formation protein|nr:Maf family protein [Phycisphaerales bacterium]